MKILKLNHRKTLILSILALLFALLFSGFISGVSAQGTSTNFQGPKGTFYGIQYAGSDYTSSSWNPASSLHSLGGTTMKFDSDYALGGKPNIFGEMTSIYIPTNTVGNLRSWVSSSWYNQLQYVGNSYPINHTWIIGDKSFGMQEWLCRWYVGFSAEWEGTIPGVWEGLGGTAKLGEIPSAQYGVYDNSYYDLSLWLEMDLKPTWYYEGAQKTYFAIGSIKLSNDVNYQGTTNQAGGLFSSNKVAPRTGVSVLPESESSMLYMYNNPFGGGNGSKQTQHSYQGQDLNPDIFRDNVYVKLDFNKFGVFSGCSVPLTYIGFWAQGDVAVVCFDVTVFTIGEWTVQDVQDDPTGYGRFVRTDTVPNDWLSWLLSSSTLVWLIPVVLIVLAVIFVPWVIFAFIAVIRAILGH